MTRVTEAQPAPGQRWTRYAFVKPPNSKWLKGWLVSMTSIDGYEVVQYPGEKPFVMSRQAWDALPEYRPNQISDPPRHDLYSSVPKRCCAMCGSSHAERAHWLYGYHEGGAAICFECAREFVTGVVHD